MSRGPWKTKPSFLSNAIKGFKRGTGRRDDQIGVIVNLKDGTAWICAKSIDLDHPRAEEEPVADGSGQVRVSCE
jgi:hypothetical protein